MASGRSSGRRTRADRGGGDFESILYGRNPIREALGAKRRTVHKVWATERAAREPWLAEHDVTKIIVGADEIAARAGVSDGHQGICAQVDPYPYVDQAELLRQPDAVIVALDEVQDPRNLGAIARSAECAGASGLVTCRHRGAAVTAAAAKASAGAVEHLPIARVRNLADFLIAAAEAGYWCYGADSGGDRYDRQSYDGGGVVLVMGAEGTGLRRRVRESCDVLVALPLRGSIASLNVASAAAVLLYQIVGRRA